MKKIVSVLALLTGATLAFGQGSVIFNNGSATYAVFTNSTRDITGAATGGGARGTASKTANSFYYALFTATYTGTLTSTNPLDPAFTFTTINGTNSPIFAGGIAGAGGGGGTTVPGWGAPTGATYDTGTRDYYLIVGWSANLGSTWAQIAPLVASGFAGNSVQNAYYGVSQLGNGYSGGGPFSLPAPSLFGVSTAMPGGITSGFDLNLVPVPEPSTFALAGLGAAAMMIFRRRK